MAPSTPGDVAAVSPSKLPNVAPLSRWGPIVLPVLLLALALAIGLIGLATFDLTPQDNYNYIGYIVELNAPDTNMRDPFMGTDVDIYPRLRVNGAMFSFAAVSAIFDADPVWLFNTGAPRVLVLASIVGVFLMLRAGRVGAVPAAAACVAFVIYFFESYWQTSLAGAFFFWKTAHDKSIAFFVIGPFALASLIWFSRLVESQPVAPGKEKLRWVALGCFALFALLGVFVHPMSLLFSTAFVVAIVLRSAIERRGLPSPPLAWAIAGLLPAIALGATFRTQLGDAVNYELFSNRRFDFADAGPFLIAEPIFFQLANIPALAWVGFRLYQRQVSYALALGIALYAVAVTVFVPGVADIVSPVAGSVAVWRFTWLLSFAFVFVVADLLSAISFKSPDRTAAVGGLCLFASLALIAFVGITRYDEYDDTFSYNPRREQRFVFDELERLSSDRDERLVVLVDDQTSRFIPSFLDNVDVVAYPEFGGPPEETDKDGREREATYVEIERATSFAELRQLMDFWGADGAVLHRRAELAPRTPQPNSPLALCMRLNTYTLVVRRDLMEGCPDAS
jgi:hypothetical protein